MAAINRRISLAIFVLLSATACASACKVVQMPPVSPMPPRNSHGQIAVVDGGGTISLYDGDGGNQVVLGEGRSPAWSPDGSKLAFDSPCDKRRCLYVMTAAGGVTKFVNNTDQNDGSPVWSPDGTQLAFESWKIPSFCIACLPPTDIYVMNSDGSHRTRLGAGSSPAWSPDGKRIAFVRSDGNGDHIYLINADASRATLLKDTEAYFAERPAWSPDGRQIVYTGIAEGGVSGGIYVIDADGNNLRQLSPIAEYSPAWSPDGKRIAFNGINVVNADGSGAVRLTDDSTGSTDPKWSPDGTKIAFTSASSSSASGLFYDTVQLCVMNADGSSNICFAQGRVSGLSVSLDIAWRP